MKRAPYILLIILLFVLGVWVFVKPIIIFIAKKQLKSTFIKSEVSIGRCALKPASELRLLDIEIKRDKIYCFKMKEARIYFDLPSLLRRKIRKFYLKDISVSVNLAQKNISDFSQYLNLKPSVFLLNSAELVNLDLNLKSKEITLKAALASTELNPIEQSINYLDLKIDSLDAGGLRLIDVSLEANKKKEGQFYIGKIQYDKIKIGQIKGRTLLEDKALSIDSLSAKVFDGELHGDLCLRIGKDVDYLCHLKFVNIDLADFVDDFNLKERFQVSGRLAGGLTLQGRGVNVNILSSDFSTVEPGGTLVIKDNKFLENMAQKSGRSLDIIAESFKDYHYNTGVMKLYLDKGNLVFDIAFEGEKGKRNLNITVHDFRDFWVQKIKEISFCEGLFKLGKGGGR
jgi:hypothetical protein